MRGYFPDDPTASAGKRRLSAFGPDIWLADGPTVSFFTFPYPTRMVLMRLGEGGLFVWSPIALAAELKAEVEAIGEPKFLVSPNKLHHLFLAEWKAAYPQAKLFASPGLRRRRRDLTFDADLIDAADPGWAEEIDQVLFKGSFAMTEAVFFHRASRTAIFADLIQALPRDSVKGWRGVLPSRRHRRAEPRGSGRLAGQLSPPKRRPRRARPGSRLGHRARRHRPWSAGAARRRSLRAPGLRLARRSGRGAADEAR